MVGWQWHQLDHVEIIWHTSFQTDIHSSTSSLNFFYRPDALPDVQPTVSKHWRQKALKAGSTWKTVEKWVCFANELERQGRTHLSAHFNEVTSDVQNKVSDAAYETLDAVTTTNLRYCVDMFDKSRDSRVSNVTEDLHKQVIISPCYIVYNVNDDQYYDAKDLLITRQQQVTCQNKQEHAYLLEN